MLSRVLHVLPKLKRGVLQVLLLCEVPVNVPAAVNAVFIDEVLVYAEVLLEVKVLDAFTMAC